MKCSDKNIKDLLPAYLARELDADEAAPVDAHLASCEDCRAELALLAMMAEETVPDPGAAFWAEMPGRVFREVRAQRSKRKIFDVSRITERLALPRWTWAAAATALVLLVSWLIINPPQKQGDDSAVWKEAYDYSYGSVHDPALTHPSTNMSELSSTELNSVDAWAGQELSAMAFEAESVMLNPAESDPAEEMAELNAREIEQFSRSLSELEEG
jgi:hypothetical protein